MAREQPRCHPEPVEGRLSEVEVQARRPRQARLWFDKLTMTTLDKLAMTTLHKLAMTILDKLAMTTLDKLAMTTLEKLTMQLWTSLP
ncbi:MAG TPA: hypothetical protein VFE17_07065 [Candidatus Baltobacteraceae bacterium]|jgi:hypothetical protein|nr:hypothetical protein [Candidatus Baltobacteraceae bacterium]